MRFTEEHVENHAKTLRGRKHTAEHNAKIGLAGRGRKLSADHVEALAASRRVPVIRINLATGEEKEYVSATAAEADGFQQGNIAHVLAGKRKTHGGFSWRYVEVTA